MKHCGTRRIETERLILRPFRPEDASDCIENYMTDERVYRWLADEPPTPEWIREKWLATCDEAYSYADTYYWAIESKDEGRVVGEIFAEDFDGENGWCELGWKVGVPWWNLGYAAEAAAAVKDYLLSRAGFHRVQARCVAENAAAERVMQELGMTCEGVLREYFRGRDGAYHDMLLYATVAES